MQFKINQFTFFIIYMTFNDFKIQNLLLQKNIKNNIFKKF